MFKSFFSRAVIIALTVSCTLAQASDSAIEKQIDQLFSRYNAATPGVAVAVVRDGRVVFAKGYGAADLEHDLPVTPRTVFQIASVSKQFTAFAVYLLEKQGKLSLDDDVRKYIPELPVHGRPVRIRHLLGHTSGVRDQAALMSLAGWRSGDVATTADVLRLLSRQTGLNFDPGSQFLYSNSGYTLLAEVVARVSGRTFAEFTKENIFQPLAMANTWFRDDHERIIKNRADSYELRNGVYKKITSNDSVAGPSNLHTTAEDMAKWVLNFEEPKVGDAELVRKFNEPSLLDNGDRVVWGVADGDPGYHANGQIHWNHRGVRLISHGGHSAAFRSFLGRFPDQRLAVVALSNDEHYANFDTSIKIAEMYLRDDLKPLPVAVSAATPPQSAIQSNIDLTAFEGRFYNGELDTSYTAKVGRGKLHLTHIRHGEIELTVSGKDRFSARIGFPAQIQFSRGANGTVTGFRISNFGAKNVMFDRD